MAIRQFNIYFIPKQSLLNKYLHIPRQLFIDYYNWDTYFKGSPEAQFTFEDAFTIFWWADLDIYTNEIFPILEIFEKEQGAVSGLKTYGNAAANNISVCFNAETGLVEEMSCQIAVLEPDMDFINKVIALAKKYDCMLMDKQGRLFEPALPQLSAAVHRAAATLLY